MSKYLGYIAFLLWAIAFSFIFDAELNDWSWPLVCLGGFFVVVAICEFDEESRNQRKR